MAYENFRVETGEDGIALVTWDMRGRSMNVINAKVMEELERIIDHVAGDAAVRSAIIVSGKDSFSGGADITMLGAISSAFDKLVAGDPIAAKQALFDESSRLSRLLRKIETCGKPFVAAIHGICMGGATELTLACHGRVMADDRKTSMALPEVKIGIFPGGGGTQRVMRMTDAQAGLEMLLKGSSIE